MTQEEKQLLLKDLYMRLLYGVIVLADLDKKFNGGSVGILVRIEPYVGKKYSELKGQYLLYQRGSLTPLTIDEVKPYLRPMSSMTEEERKELSIILNYEFYVDDDFALAAEDDRHRIRLELCDGYIDWLNEHHFDYRGLIEKSLALEAPEGMYKIN